MLKLLTLVAAMSTIAIPSIKEYRSEFIKENNPAISEALRTKAISTEFKLNPEDEELYSKQYLSMNNIGDIENVWEVYRGKGQTISIIDSGIYVDHDDFNDGEWYHVSLGSRFFYLDSNKEITKTDIGSNYENKDAFVPLEDSKGVKDHGNSVAAVAAAAISGKGTVGVAPDATILMAKTDFSIIAMSYAIQYSANMGVKVINISQGISTTSTEIINELQNAVDYAYQKGCIIVAAAGNESTTTPFYPAALNHVIGVGALAANSPDTISSYSNSNGSLTTRRNVDIVAPGTVYTAAGYSEGVSYYTSDSGISGTSFSSPIVAGAAALYMEKHPDATPDDFEKALYASATDLGSEGDDLVYGHGALNIAKLMADDPIEADTTIEQEGNTISWKDELGWNFRTLHLYDLEFADGYSYEDLEFYFNDVLGQRESRDTWNMEGTDEGWCYNVPGRENDYLVRVGGEGPEYSLDLPWWVTGAKYQYVNNNHWVNDEGCEITDSNNRYLAENKSYIYNDNGNAGVSTVTPISGNTITVKASNITYNITLPDGSIIQQLPVPAASVYDYYEPLPLSGNNLKFLGYYYDINHQNELGDNIKPSGSNIEYYVLANAYPGEMFFQDQGWGQMYTYESYTVNGVKYEPLGPWPGLPMTKIENYNFDGSIIWAGEVSGYTPNLPDGTTPTIIFNNGNTTNYQITTTYNPGKLTLNNGTQWVTYTNDFQAGFDFIRKLINTMNQVEGTDSYGPGSICGLLEVATQILDEYSQLDNNGLICVGHSNIVTYLPNGSGNKGDVSVNAIISQLAKMAAGYGISANTNEEVHATDFGTVVTLIAVFASFSLLALLVVKKRFNIRTSK